MEIPVVLLLWVIAISSFEKFTAVPIESSVVAEKIVPGLLVDLFDVGFMLDIKLNIALFRNGVTLLRFFERQVEVGDDIFNCLSLFFQYFGEVVLKRRQYIFNILIGLSIGDGETQATAFHRHTWKNADVRVEPFCQKFLYHCITYPW